MADQSQTENSITEANADGIGTEQPAANGAETKSTTAARKTTTRAPRRRTKPTTQSTQGDEPVQLTLDSVDEPTQPANQVANPSPTDESSAAPADEPAIQGADAAPADESPAAPTVVNDDLPRPPSGRRSKTRPAGPPSDRAAEVTPAADNAAEAAASSASEDSTDEAAEKPRSSRSRSSRSKAPSATQPAEQSTANDDRQATNAGQSQNADQAQNADQPDKGVADSAVGGQTDGVAAAMDAMPKRTRSRSGQRQAAAQLLGDVPTDENGEVDKAAALQSLAAAIAGAAETSSDAASEDPQSASQAAPSADGAEDQVEADTETADEHSADEHSAGEHSADEDSADEQTEGEKAQEGQSSSSRRRRRRGGRRRRRSGGGANDAETPTESDEEEDDSPTDAEVSDGSDATDQDAAPETDGSEDAAADGEGSAEGVRRRRRRRRGSGGGTDDADVVIEVREPRQRATSDEVTGIEGSTRLEAKRQRRKEGRAAGRSRAPILTEAEFLARRESVNRKMIVRQSPEYTQIAVLEDDILVEHYVDRDSSASAIGNVYLGKVQNVLPSMEAVFVDIGRGRNAVLYAGEVNWDAFEVADDQRKVEEVFKSGQSVLVQVSKDSVGAKGARLTGHISIPGRFVVYSPDGHLSGISRKLPDTERARLKTVLDDVVGEQGSVIVRTAAEGASEEELVKDVERLKAHWEVIERKAKQGGAPAQLYTEPDLTLRTIRDVFTEDFNELVVAGVPGANDVYENIDQYVQTVAPSLHDRLSRWDSESQGDPFEKYRIEEQISKALERKVFLPSGGSLVIDRTEAMTVIDVNTGKFTGTGGNLEETVTRNNLEAAEEIVRQLRLRDLGGIVVIDFIDMVLPSNRELLLRRLVECLGRDRTRHQVSEVTSLGLVQLTRKRIGTGLAEAFTEECDACGGRGFIRHEHPVATQAPADGGDRGRHNGRHDAETKSRNGGSSNRSANSRSTKKSTTKKSTPKKAADPNPEAEAQAAEG